jgi:hypothetical protein
LELLWNLGLGFGTSAPYACPLQQIPPKPRGILLPCLLIRYSWGFRIHLQNAVTFEPRMHMDVQMRDLLERRFTDRMP